MVVEKIENRTQLQLKIMELHARAFEQETQIAHRMKEMSYLLQPAMLLKRIMSNIGNNPEVKSDLLNAGKSFTSTLVSNALLRNRKGVAGAMVFMVLKRVFSYILQRRAEKRAARKR